MRSILAVNSNGCSISSIPTIMDNLIDELSRCDAYNEINYHDNDWYSTELESRLGSRCMQSFLKSHIFLELVSAKFLLIDVTSCCTLLTNRHLNFLDYLVPPYQPN